MRKELREAGVTYKVYKNTMMHRAFEGTQCEELIQHLHGTNAIAISATDATAPARILDKFAKKAPALEFRHWLESRPEKNFLANCLEASSLRLQTSLVCLIRSLRKTALKQQLNNF